MKKFGIFLFISLFIVSISCDDNSTDGGYYTNGLIPFKLNNSWEYVHFIYDTSGNIRGQDTTLTEVVRDTVISKTHFYAYGNWGDYYTTNGDGVWIYLFYQNGNEEHYLYYKYPCKTNDTYSFPLGRPPAIVTVLSIDKNVQVEAGAYSCILYRFDLEGIDSYSNFYISPGIGIVMYEHYETSPQNKIYKSSEERLLSYQLN
jgi:hypothetical protein